MRDCSGRVIYVGKALNLRRRLRDYFGARGHGDPKVRALVSLVADFEIHITSSERSALLLEERLIGDLLPKFNVSLRYGRRRYWILTRNDGETLPRLEITNERSVSNRDTKISGPYASYAAACWLVRWVNRNYGLRSCSPRFPTQEDFDHCQEHTVNRCLAPCVGLVSQDDYQAQVNKAIQWLEQPRWKIVRFLKEEMRVLAKGRQFEKAAQYRDMISCLAGAGNSLPPAGIKVDQGLAQNQQESLKVLMNLNRLETIECFDISHSGGTENVASLVRFKQGLPEKKEYRYYCLAVAGANDYASIKEAVMRRYRLGNPPDLVVVDGGLPQLSAGKDALSEVSCVVPLIALAKEDERIFFTDGTSLKLPNDSPALHLVQRIRDEAHRRANGYTRRRSSQKVTASILETVPGLNNDLRRAMLREFGSVARIRVADADDLMKIPGVDRKLAERIILKLKTAQG